jgi:hypothetical protein
MPGERTSCVLLLLTMANMHVFSPGRFFAVTEMKLVLMHLVMNYDVKLLPGTAPRPLIMGTAIIPDPKLPVLFRKRPTVG